MTWYSSVAFFTLVFCSLASFVLIAQLVLDYFLHLNYPVLLHSCRLLLFLSSLSFFALQMLHSPLLPPVPLLPLHLCNPMFLCFYLYLSCSSLASFILTAQCSSVFFLRLYCYSIITFVFIVPLLLLSSLFPRVPLCFFQFYYPLFLCYFIIVLLFRYFHLYCSSVSVFIFITRVSVLHL